jgi:hypothetical protein
VAYVFISDQKILLRRNECLTTLSRPNIDCTPIRQRCFDLMLLLDIEYVEILQRISVLTNCHVSAVPHQMDEFYAWKKSHKWLDKIDSLWGFESPLLIIGKIL